MPETRPPPPNAIAHQMFLGTVAVCLISVFPGKLQQIGEKPLIHAKRTPSAFSVLRVPPRTSAVLPAPRSANP